MQADYSVELGADDPALEMPWRSDDGSFRYFNLKASPDLVLNLPEARKHPELSAFLSRMNAPDFFLETAKCDASFSTELAPEEEIFGAACKFASYVDLIFSDDSTRFSLEKHETLAREVCTLLKRAPEMAAACEFVVRHCHFHHSDGKENSRIGFCITAYVSGYGDSEEEAHQRWAIALKLLQNALIQTSKTKIFNPEEQGKQRN